MVMVQKFIISDQFHVCRICVEVLHRKEDQYKKNNNNNNNNNNTEHGRSDTGNLSDLYL